MLRSFLPDHIPQDTVGGKSQVNADITLMNGAFSSLSSLHEALRKAFSISRWFRHPFQWIMVYMTMYMPAAVAAEHWALEQCLGHFHVITKIFEKERHIANGNAHLALLYDDRIRRKFGALCESKGPKLDFDKHCLKVYDRVYADAKQRPQATLESVGLGSSSRQPFPPALPAGTVTWSDVTSAGNPDNRASTWIATAEQVEKNVEAARRKLQLERKIFEEKKATLPLQDHGGPSNTALKRAGHQARIEADRLWKGRDDEWHDTPKRHKGDKGGKGGKGKGGKGGKSRGSYSNSTYTPRRDDHDRC